MRLSFIETGASMARKTDYGMDVKWEAHEVVALRKYIDLCREQAMAIFEGHLAAPVPAMVLAERARASVV
jgi:hypothetical protein